MKKLSIFMQKLMGALTASVVFLTVLSNAGYAQGDGPRAYFPTPDGMKTIAGYGLFVSGNTVFDSGVINRNADLDMNIGVAQYTQSFAIGDRLAGAFAIVPFGDVTGSISGPFAGLKGDSNGFGDVILGGIVALRGVPALTQQDYAAFNPNLSVGVLAKITLPTGSYSQSKAINLGSNRWAAQFGVPVVYYFGNSFLDPKLTVLEVSPSVTFYSKNSSAFGGGTISQKPLYQVEAHLSHNITRVMFLSVDGLWINGGETSNNGVSNDDKQSSFSLGASIGLNLSRSTSIKVSYGQVVNRNSNGADGDMVRIILSKSF